MATYDAAINSGGAGSFTLRLVANETSINEAANTSDVGFTLTIICNSGFAFNSDPVTGWGVTIDGTNYSGSFAYNLSAGQSLQVGSGTKTGIAHNADGTKTISVGGSIGGPGPLISGEVTGTLPLTNFSRPPLAPASCTVSVSGRNATVTSGVADVTNRPAITSYQVERTTNDGVTWSGTVNTMDGSRQFLYSSLDGGKFYKFRTRAVNSEGAGAWRESASTFIPAGGRRWTGSAWSPTQTAKRWNGSAWVDISTAKRWNGSAWIDLT